MQAPLINILQPQVQSQAAVGEGVVKTEGDAALNAEFMNLLGQLEGEVSPEAQAGMLTKEGKSLETPILPIGSESKESLSSLVKNKIEGQSIEGDTSVLENVNPKEAALAEKKAHLFQALSPIAVKGKAQKQASMNLQTGDDFLKNMATTNKEHIINVKDGQAQQTQVSHMGSYAKGRDLLDNNILKTSHMGFSSKASSTSLFGNENSDVESTQAPKLELVQNQETELLWNRSEGGESESGGFKSSKSQQVIDLSSIKAENKTALIGKITQYIEQAKLQNTDSLDLLVKHEDLGQFRVIVNKAPAGIGQNNMIDLQIQSASKAGHNFFVDNEADMIRTLADAGVKLADVKIIKGAEFNLASDAGSKSFDGNQQSENSSNNQNGFKHQRQSGDKNSQRRQEMWEYYKEKASA